MTYVQLSNYCRSKAREGPGSMRHYSRSDQVEENGWQVGGILCEDEGIMKWDLNFRWDQRSSKCMVICRDFPCKIRDGTMWDLHICLFQGAIDGRSTWHWQDSRILWFFGETLTDLKRRWKSHEQNRKIAYTNPINHTIRWRFGAFSPWVL